MRVLVTAAGGFVGAHVLAALGRGGHEAILVADLGRPVDAVVHLAPVETRAALDLAVRCGARRFVLVSSLGADPGAHARQLAARGRAEVLVRAAGLPYTILRPEILWGPGDVFTNELAHLLRHLPFVPVPRGGAWLAPIHAADVAAVAARAATGRSDLRDESWELVGPETLTYAEIIERIAEALEYARRPRLRVPAWSVRLGAKLEERIAHRPPTTRSLLDRLVAGAPAPGHVLALPRRPFSSEELEYLVRRPIADQLARV
jgi:NADH dehydrogenase